MSYAAKAYAKIAKETQSPRELEASLLLKAAAKLQTAYDSWQDRKTPGLSDALLYNRRLWTVLLDALVRDGNRLPDGLRNNLKQLGMLVMRETFSLMTDPRPEQLTAIIKVNRGIAAGLRPKA